MKIQGVQVLNADYKGYSKNIFYKNHLLAVGRGK